MGDVEWMGDVIYFYMIYIGWVQNWEIELLIFKRLHFLIIFGVAHIGLTCKTLN